MFFKKFREINKVCFKFLSRRFQYFKFDTVLRFLSNIVYIVLNILFWFLVKDAGFSIKGWTFDDILVVAFSELFYSIESSMFGMVSRFWKVIYSGALDTLLIRPLDPRLRFAMLNINYGGILDAFIKFIILLLISRKQVSIIMILAGIIVVFFANTILALIRLFLSYSAFWFGKMDALSELADSMTQFNKYPLVIMPKFTKILFTFAIPFYFFSTFSSELVLGKLNSITLIIGILGLCVNLLLWIVLNNILWKKGRARYESING
jgi:ABC-2 type transport system permease protein